MADLPPLSVPPEEMRRLGYRVVDMLVDHFAGLRNKPATRVPPRNEVAASLPSDFPDEPTPVEELLTQLDDTVFPAMGLTTHPRFFAFVPSPSNYLSVLGDALAAGYNAFLGNWLEASGPARIEEVTVDWLRRLCGLPEGAGGLFVSGGSVANLTALAVARGVKLPIAAAPLRRQAVAFCSDQTHSCVERAFRLMGFESEQLVRIPSDAKFRLSIDTLRSHVAAARRDDRLPFCVIANAGTTNTGAVDPLSELADYCEAENLWLHVDGAYGAAAMLSQRGRTLLQGLDRADSLAIDPHKWLFQPYEIGCVLVRDGRQLPDTFRATAEYLSVVQRVAEVNYQDCGIQLTRSFRALKLWLSLRGFGVSAFRAAVDRGIDLAEFAADTIRRTPGLELVTPAQLAVVAFRVVRPDLSPEDADAANEQVVSRTLAEGYATVTSTSLGGRRVLRLCTINPRTTEDDIRETLRRLAELGSAPIRR